ncbi:hypothetical protein NXX52_14270 [Bacteroides ovatus]|nr:hypothetical protein [Bacteroides ovatus]
MSYHLNGAMLDTMSQEFTSRYHHLPEETKSLFDDTLICQLAEQGNHVVMVALNLVCGYVDDATTIAQTHGGGGGPPLVGEGSRKMMTVSGHVGVWQWHARCVRHLSNGRRECNGKPVGL